MTRDETTETETETDGWDDEPAATSDGDDESPALERLRAELGGEDADAAELRRAWDRERALTALQGSDDREIERVVVHYTDGSTEAIEP